MRGHLVRGRVAVVVGGERVEGARVVQRRNCPPRLDRGGAVLVPRERLFALLALRALHDPELPAVGRVAAVDRAVGGGNRGYSEASGGEDERRDGDDCGRRRARQPTEVMT